MERKTTVRQYLYSLSGESRATETNVINGILRNIQNTIFEGATKDEIYSKTDIIRRNKDVFSEYET